MSCILLSSDNHSFELDADDATFFTKLVDLPSLRSHNYRLAFTAAQLEPVVDYLRARKNIPQVPIGKDVIGGVRRLRKPCHWNQEVDAIDFAHTERWKPDPDHNTPAKAVAELIHIAHELDIKPMFEVWCAYLAMMISRPNLRNPLDVIRNFWGRHLTDDEAMKIWEELPRTEEEEEYLRKNLSFV